MATDQPLFDPEAFLLGRYGNPASCFGMFPDLRGGLFLRAFLPWAERVEVLKLHGKTASAAGEMERVHPEGIWELRLPRHRSIFPYRFRIHADGQATELDDAYRFGSVLGEMDRYLLGEGNHWRPYDRMGAHPCVRDGVEGTTFAAWAPNALRVSVVGQFNGWDGRRHPLYRCGPPGTWELFVPHVRVGDTYKFEIQGPDGRLLPLKADPYAFRCEPSPGTASIVHGLQPFEWGDEAWMRNRWLTNSHRAPISIYEVHLGSWRKGWQGEFLTYRQLAETLLPYAKGLGFTHLQLLPVSEHPLYSSWGYQPLGLFAPTSRYGTPEDFKAFVDACHREGMGVILDWVPAHFPEDAHGLGFFDGTHLFEHEDPRQGRHMDWGTLIYNYSRTEVQNFLIANALFWFDQFHIDGLRVDAVASMLYQDYSRGEGQWIPNKYGGRENIDAVAFLRRLNEVVYGQHPNVMMIAEESTAWPMVSRPVHAGGLGFGYKWNMGWMNDTLRYLSRNMLHRKYHHDEITFSMIYAFSENYTLPLSHDEVVHGKRSLLWRMPGSRWEQFANVRLLLAYQFAHTGKKLLFMGNEIAQDREWDHNGEVDWRLLEHEPHQGIQNLVRDLNGIYRRQRALHELDCEPGGFRWIDCKDRKNSVIAMVRPGAKAGDFVVAVLNFSGQAHASYRVGVPALGNYAEILNTDSAHYGGSNFGNLGSIAAQDKPWHGMPCSLCLALPPLAALFLRPVQGGNGSEAPNVRGASNGRGNP